MGRLQKLIISNMTEELTNKDNNNHIHNNINNNRLSIPHHSYNNSVTSNSSSNTPGLSGYNSNYRTHKSGSSISRLSRTNTNNTESIYPPNAYDSQSIRTADRIPTAKPSVTYLDKLWTQIDVLDDVRYMSEQVKLKGSFFNDKFNEGLGKLKQLQNELFEVMATQHFSNPTNKAHNEKLYKLNAVDPNGSNANTLDQIKEEGGRGNGEKLAEFFNEDAEDLKTILYRKQNFDEMNQYIEEIKVNLNNVGESMKKFDESTRDLW